MNYIFGQYIYVLSEVNVNDLSLKKEMNARYLRLFLKKKLKRIYFAMGVKISVSFSYQISRLTSFKLCTFKTAE